MRIRAALRDSVGPAFTQDLCPRLTNIATPWLEGMTGSNPSLLAANVVLTHTLKPILFEKSLTARLKSCRSQIDSWMTSTQEFRSAAETNNKVLNRPAELQMEKA